MHDCSGKFKITPLSFGRHAEALTVFELFDVLSLVKP